jgi:hypothetical protein
MIVSSTCLRALSHALAGVAALLACGVMLSGCADMSDGMTAAFADPSKYDLYDCKQLEAERIGLEVRMAELKGLMSKAQEGVAGPVVAQVVYHDDYIALRGQKKVADGVWVLNKCHETLGVKAPTPAPAPATTSGHKRSGNAVY